VRRTLVTLTLLAVIGALVASCGGGKSGSGGSQSGGAAVTVDNFAFTPASLNVKAGQQVTWTNKQQGVTHTVTADGGAFDHQLPSAATFSFTFAKAGSFPYHCTIHSSMHGTIVVS
jgi:plastocyanin